MVDLAGLASIGQRGHQTIQQARPPIGGLQKHGAAVRTGVGAVKPGDEGLEKRSWKRTVCATEPDRKNGFLLWRKRLRTPVFYHGKAFILHPFVNDPGQGLYEHCDQAFPLVMDCACGLCRVLVVDRATQIPAVSSSR